MQDFRTCMNLIVNQSQKLTKIHQDEIGSWSSNQYENSTLISDTGAFILRFENLLNSVQNITYPPDSEYVQNALVNSLKYETGSYKQFRNYLQLGNKKKDTISTNLLSSAFLYEQIYSKFFNALNIVNCRSNELY